MEKSDHTDNSSTDLAYKKTIENIDKVLKSVDEVRSQINNRNFAKECNTYPWSLFIRTMRLLTAQSSGARIQNYLIHFFNWTKVNQAEDRGDARVGEKYFEIKITLISGSNTGANFVQIRPHQDIDWYELFVIDGDNNISRYKLTKIQMQEELNLIGASAHGTKNAVTDNKNREYAIRFPWSDSNDIKKRWDKKYKDTLGINPDQMPFASYENSKFIYEKRQNKKPAK
jgi:hypothetical protein